jgi:small subunit ribosomal protein S16
VGRKKQPAYRIVVADRLAARDGQFIETLGHYDPRTDPATIQVNADRAKHWLSEGATPSETVRSLLKKAGVFSATPVAAATAEAAVSEPAAADAEPASDATEG